MNLQDLKQALLAKAEELGASAAAKEEIAIEREAETLDSIQHASNRELALATISRNWRTAMMVSEALDRVEDGSYGTCLSCEEPISEKRLKAIPWAKCCIRCQELADRQGKNYDKDALPALAA